MFNLFSSKNTAYSSIAPHQLAQKLKQADLPLVVDVREPYEYAQGHIKGSQLLPLGQLRARVQELGAPEREIVVVCRSGGRSSQAALQLAALGYKNLFNLDGGMMAWQRAGLSVQQ